MSDKKNTPKETIGVLIDNFDENNIQLDKNQLQKLKNLPLEREVITWDKI